MQGAIRTHTEEVLIQDGSPEQNAWHRITTLHRAQEKYAYECAKRIIAILEMTAQKSGVLVALKLCRDTGLLRGWIELYQVTEEHEEFCLELVKGCFEARYPL